MFFFCFFFFIPFGIHLISSNVWYTWEKWFEFGRKYWKLDQNYCWLIWENICWLFSCVFFVFKVQWYRMSSNFLPFNPFLLVSLMNYWPDSHHLTLYAYIFRTFVFIWIHLFAIRIHVVPILIAKQTKCIIFNGHEMFLVNIP